MKPLISVVIPVFNRGWELERALNSLTTQTFMDFEVLVCDDGSTEDIESIVKPYEDSLNVRYFKMQNFGGPARPRNVGIKNANGKWIAFLDSDDWWDSNRFELLKSHLTDNNDFIYHQLKVVKANDLNRIGDRRRLVGSPFLFSPLKHMALFGNPIPNSSVIVKKSVLEEIGRLSEDVELISVEDFDAWLKIAELGAKMTYVSSPLGFYWIGNDGISALTEKQVLKYKKIFNYHVANFDPEYLDIATSYYHYNLGSMLLSLGEDLNLAKSEFLLANELPSFKIKILKIVKILLIYYKKFTSLNK